MRHERLQLVRKRRITGGKRHANAQGVEWHRGVPGGGQTYGIFFGRDEIRRPLFVDRSHNGLPIFLRIGVMVRENEQGLPPLRPAV